MPVNGVSSYDRSLTVAIYLICSGKQETGAATYLDGESPFGAHLERKFLLGSQLSEGKDDGGWCYL